jgi:hypothetical protein
MSVHRPFHFSGSLLSLLISAVLLPLWTQPGAASETGNPPVRDLAGRIIRPLGGKALKERKATVLLFIAHDCPISNQYAPEIARIVRRYSPKRVAFYTVYSEPGLSGTIAQKHAADYKFGATALLDPKQTLARRVGATVTPEAALLDAAGKLIYRGRIDDLYLDFGKRRFEVQTRDLRNALDAALAGKAPPVKVTNAVGCYIPAPH